MIAQDAQNLDRKPSAAIAVRNLGPIAAVACNPHNRLTDARGKDALQSAQRQILPHRGPVCAFQRGPTTGMIILVTRDNALSRELIRELLNILSKCRLGDVKPLRRSSDVQRPGYSMKYRRWRFSSMRLLPGRSGKCPRTIAIERGSQSSYGFTVSAMAA